MVGGGRAPPRARGIPAVHAVRRGPRVREARPRARRRRRALPVPARERRRARRRLPRRRGAPVARRDRRRGGPPRRRRHRDLLRHRAERDGWPAREVPGVRGPRADGRGEDARDRRRDPCALALRQTRGDAPPRREARDRRGERADRGVGGAPPGSVRGVQVRDRHAQADGAGLEEGALRGRRGLGGAGGR